jgi:aryl-alcohol dehydrogenase-like predicted oxidoreductase
MAQQDRSRFSRRAVVQTGLLAGVGAALPGSLLVAADAGLPVITKPIPSTGEKIPVIGIGTDRFGDIPAGTSTVRDLLKRMVEMGGTVIDTAALYAGSEERIGPALNELNLRSRVFLISKMNSAGAVNDPPKKPGSRHGVDPLSGVDSFNRSLKRLQTDKIDLMMAHWLSSVDPLMPVMINLKKQGKTRYIGFSTVVPQQHARIAGYMRKYPVDFVQVEYSLNDRSAEKEVFPVSMQKKIGISVAKPFGDETNAMFTKVKGRALPPWAADYDIATWGQFFLKYVVSHPAVTNAVPGSTQLTHLEDNQAAGRGRLPDAAARRKMEDFWAGMT